MKCQRCNKKARGGQNVSHAENKSTRKFKPNIQKKTFFDKQGNKKTMRLCTRCIKDMKRKDQMFYRPPEERDDS